MKVSTICSQEINILMVPRFMVLVMLHSGDTVVPVFFVFVFLHFNPVNELYFLYT